MIDRIVAGVAGRFIALLVTLRMIRRPGRAADEPAVTDAAAIAGGDASYDDDDPSRRDVPHNPRAERIVAALLLGAALCGFGFTAVYVVDELNDQLLGIALGGMFLLLGAASIVAGKAVVVQETAVEDRGLPLLEPGAPEEITEMIASGGEGISRRGMLTGAAGVAGAAAVTAGATPIASLGPKLTYIHKTPWARGVRFVDESSRPYRASDIQIGSMYTALPEDRDWETLGSGLMVVRLPEHLIDLPAARKNWAPQGILAYSKTCPHAACAISLYRYPLYPPGGDTLPAFTCPCHYSTFLPGQGGKLIFGPAGRPLPQLPVMIDAEGYLRAAGGFDEDVGPSWFDVRRVSS
ncbi:MAG TPA: Rieske (2Fe-2S) protein [Solirubrobacteraceae bacterium]|nr:Rieske (2Fe-2S) protein [Solirubrobacteraceae bacterium]